MYPARLVATIVIGLLLAACGSGGEATDGDANQGAGTVIEVTAGDLFFEPETLTASSPGEVAIALDNQGAAVHNVVIEEAGDTKVVEAQGGSSDSGTIELEPGTYTFYCDIAGHREAGMEGTLTVGG